MSIDRLHSGFVTSEGIHTLSPREAAEWCAEGAVLLDVREESMNQFKKFGVPVLLQIPLGRLNDELHRLPIDGEIIVADTSGLHSREACLLLERQGFTRVSNLAGGLVEWERDGMPLLTDTGERLSGSCACQLLPREKRKPLKK